MKVDTVGIYARFAPPGRGFRPSSGPAPRRAPAGGQLCPPCRRRHRLHRTGNTDYAGCFAQMCETENKTLRKYPPCTTINNCSGRSGGHRIRRNAKTYRAAPDTERKEQWRTAL